VRGGFAKAGPMLIAAANAAPAKPQLLINAVTGDVKF
jgi:hypothetical protein